MKAQEWLTWTLGGMLLASIAFNVYQWRGPSRTPPPLTEATALRHLRQPLAQALALTDEQRSRITSCCGACSVDRARLAREVEQRLEELEAALSQRPIDQARAYRLADEVGELRAQILKSRVHSIFLVRNSLTPEQLRLLADGGPR